MNRVGEENINNFGSKMVIVKYNNAKNIDVYFPEYNWTTKDIQYGNFKRGNVKCPYERRYFYKGYIGEGEYEIYDNGKHSKYYKTWTHMLERCYDEKIYKKHPTYKDCEVVEEWYNLQNFGNWFTDNYYEIDGETMCLDKDILHKGNKIYSPENCVFVPNNINVLFTKRDKSRGDYPIGVCYNKKNKKFQAYCRIHDYKENKSKLIHLGYHNSPERAFQSYKEYKEKHIKDVADYYKYLIPNKLYQALYDYQVEITD